MHTADRRKWSKLKGFGKFLERSKPTNEADEAKKERCIALNTLRRAAFMRKHPEYFERVMV